MAHCPPEPIFRYAAMCDDYMCYAYLFADKIQLITVAKTMEHFRAPCMCTEIRVLFYKMLQGDVGEVHEKGSYYLFSCFTELRGIGFFIHYHLLYDYGLFCTVSYTFANVFASMLFTWVNFRNE